MTTPGYKTVTFWLTAATTAVAALASSGATDSPAAAQVIAVAMAALGGAGYASWRAFKKSEAGAKPAWRTTEFWMSLANVAVGALIASGAFVDGSATARILGATSAVIVALGYGARDKLPPVTS